MCSSSITREADIIERIKQQNSTNTDYITKAQWAHLVGKNIFRETSNHENFAEYVCLVSKVKYKLLWLNY